VGWWGLPTRSPPASLLWDGPIRAVGADCPEPGCVACAVATAVAD